MRKYEFVFILDPSVDEAGANESLERYAKIIRDHGGDISQQQNWGRRRFAYDIKKKTEGTYLYLRHRADTKTIAELNRVLRFDERVLRSLIVLDEDIEARNAASAAKRQGPPGERGPQQNPAVV